MIAGNNANDGGGVCCYSSSPTIDSNVIDANASFTGAGIGCYTSSPAVTNNRITGNVASFSGGGIRCFQSSPIISNNVIASNIALSHGGGIACDLSRPSVSNNIVAFNSSGMYRTGYVQWAALRNNCVFGNTLYDYKGLSPGPGDISLDPLFRDAANGDYRLLPASPCVDAGTNDGAPSTDFDGNPRPVDGNLDGLAITDIGAFECQVIPVTIDVLPGDGANIIKVQPNRLITVAIIADGSLDLRFVNIASVTLGPSMAAREVHNRGHWEDANGDGRLDLVLHFRCGETGIRPGDTSVTLRGRLNTGEPFIGSAAVVAR